MTQPVKLKIEKDDVDEEDPVQEGKKTVYNRKKVRIKRPKTFGKFKKRNKK
jgi:hypothetical protein